MDTGGNMLVFWKDNGGSGHRQRICQCSERTREGVATGGEYVSVLGGQEREWTQAENMAVFLED